MSHQNRPDSVPHDLFLRFSGVLQNEPKPGRSDPQKCEKHTRVVYMTWSAGCEQPSGARSSLPTKGREEARTHGSALPWSLGGISRPPWVPPGMLLASLGPPAFPGSWFSFSYTGSQG